MSSKDRDMVSRSLLWKSDSEEETIEKGRRLGSHLEEGDILALTGPLGSGKTRLVKGVALGLGVARAEDVKSPTFVYLRIHKGRIPLYHLDAYRFQGPEGFEAIGGWELLREDGVGVIEWADRLGDDLPEDRLDIEMILAGATMREIRITARGEAASRLESIGNAA